MEITLLKYKYLEIEMIYMKDIFNTPRSIKRHVGALFYFIESREECHDRKQNKQQKRKPYKVHLHLYVKSFKI